MRRLSPPVAALACLLVALLAWVSPAAAQTVRLPGGVQPLMQQRPCLEDCDPPPNSPPVVTIVAPGGTVATRTPVVLARFQPGGTVPSDEIYSVSVSWEGTNVTALGRTNASRLFEWEVSSSHQLSPGTQKVLSVTVCSQALLCTIEVRHVWLDVGNGPILSFMPMPLEALGRRPSSALGPDFAIGGTDVVTAVSTPAYYSRDTPRTAGLTYSSRQSYPRAVVNVDLEFSGGAPSWLKMRLLDGAVVLDSFVQVTPSCTSGGQARCRATLQTSFLAASSYPAVRKWLRVEAQATVGGQNYSSTDSVEAVLVDRRATPYGSGWWPSGVFRLVTAGADAIIVADDGSATIYRGNDNTYLSPPGDYSALVKTGSGWELQFREGGKLIFDSQGRQTAIQGTYPLWQTTISYNTADQVYRITDPAGKYFQFSYGSGVTIQDPGGRSSGAGLSNGQLISWTPPTPSGHNYTRAFAWRPFASNAVLPDSVGNALGQYTTLQYDSHWQPLQVQLPVVQNDSGSAVRPVLRYEAQELRGVGAAASLDTLRAHAVDARGNWSSSRLNRWGQSLMSWDVVDTTSRNTYSDIGLLLTSEGKSGDSTRVYYTYDALGHLIHTHRLGGPGGTLRLDSLVWDANHRVIKRFGTFSDSTIYQYNGAGSVTYTASSVGDTTLNYYNMYTLRLDSTHTAGVAGTTKFFHGGTFANTDSVRAPDGTTISRNLYDGYGRLTSAASKTVVQATSGSTELQWRRRLIYFNVANQVDSVRIERTDNCTAPCLNPSWPDPADTLRTLARRRIYAYLGQDSVLVGPTGGAEEVTAYDALGRIVSRSVAGSPTETYRYDRAGNLRFRVTRRGYQLESQYDTRNRVTKSVIPTVGTFNYAYGGANGPNDELTSVTAEAGYADPVGGSNPNVAWAFNPAGRVLSETTQGNRTTSFAYDIYGRVASFADAIGTWQLRFHTQHGTPDTLVTPFGDRVAYALDGQGRLDGPWLTGTGASLSRTQEWRTQGGLGVLTNAVNGGAYVPGRLRLADTEPDAAYDSLSPLWTEQRGLGQPTHTAVDSLRFDGWGRVTRAFGLPPLL
jgi:YD repeat-containing protein